MSISGSNPAIAGLSAEEITARSEAPCRHYYIVRFFQGDRRPRRIKRGLTLEDAKAHCHDPETSSSTATSAAAMRYTRAHGAWFDGYGEEPGR